MIMTVNRNRKLETVLCLSCSTRSARCLSLSRTAPHVYLFERRQYIVEHARSSLFAWKLTCQLIELAALKVSQR